MFLCQHLLSDDDKIENDLAFLVVENALRNLANLSRSLGKICKVFMARHLRAASLPTRQTIGLSGRRAVKTAQNRLSLLKLPLPIPVGGSHLFRDLSATSSVMSSAVLMIHRTKPSSPSTGVLVIDQ
jgi:hypothetical protein